MADTYSARPGHSEHQPGRAFIMNEEMERFEGTTKTIWLGEYAHEYRFIIRYPQPLTHLTRYQYEPWHITYVEKPVEELIKQNQIQMLKKYKVNFMDYRL